MGLFTEQEIHDMMEAKNRAIQDYMSEYKLDDLAEENAVLKKVVSQFLIRPRFVPSSAKDEDKAIVAYLEMLVEQNWIIIRELGRISGKNEK